jgi:hypothetical protein
MTELLSNTGDGRTDDLASFFGELQDESAQFTLAATEATAAGPDTVRTQGLSSPNIIKALIASEHIEIFEKAILAASKRNRAEAMAEICRVYLDAKRQHDFPGQSEAAPVGAEASN